MGVGRDGPFKLESYRYLQNWTTEEGVPEDVLLRLKKLYASKYPNDYTMQKVLVVDQCESYLFMEMYIVTRVGKNYV